MVDAGRPLPLAELRRAAWYLAMYDKRSDKTKQRDLRGLREGGWLREDTQAQLWRGFLPQPGQ